MAEIQGLERELAAAQAEIQRVEWNRAIRKAAKLADNCWAVGRGERLRAAYTAQAILKLLKPVPVRGKKQKPVVITTPVPTLEEFRVMLGISKKRAAKIGKIMETPVPRRKLPPA